MANTMVQDEHGGLNVPATTMIDNIPWRVIPATAIAAGIFYGLEQMNAGLAKTLAALAFITSFALRRPDYQGWPANAGRRTPLETLLKTTGISSDGTFGTGIN